MSSNHSLNIVFAGTPEFSAEILESLCDAGHNVTAVYCQPDRRVGRGKKIAYGAVKSVALERKIAVEQPHGFNQDVDESGLTALEKLANYQPDLMIVVAYGLLLPQDVLDTPKYGCVNIHASLLPKWRGAAPIQRSIASGDSKTGVTIMQMDKGLDTGNMLLKKSCDILPEDTGLSLHGRLADIGSRAISEFLGSFSKNNGSSFFPGEVQDDKNSCYAHKLTKAEAEIDWSAPALVILRKIRAFNAWPVCFTYVGSNRLRLWQAVTTDTGDLEEPAASALKPGEVIRFGKSGIVVRCGDGHCLVLTLLQADGSRAMSAAEMLNSKSAWFSDNPVLGQSGGSESNE